MSGLIKKSSFIISNYPLINSKKIQNLYIKGNYIKIENYILIFKGYLFPENKLDEKQLLISIIKNGLDIISKLKGNFCGVFCDLDENIISFFTDKVRYFDLFYYFSNDIFLISDKFIEMMRSKLFSVIDVNIQALLEFVIFEYPILGKTFLNEIYFVPLGSIYQIDLTQKTLEKKNYYNIIFKPNRDFYKNRRYDDLEKLFDNAIIRIKGLFPSNIIYGLGLSGGLDSRLTAYLAKKHDLKIKTFIFGEKKSDAYYIARKIARKLRLDHYELGYERDFFQYAEKGINYNPMMSLYYAWYYAIYKRLPKFNIFLTGFFGGGQYGELHKTSYLYIKNSEQFANEILNAYFKYDLGEDGIDFFKNKSLLSRIKGDLINFSTNSPNSEYWEKFEEFNYKRQLIYVKNNPSFNFYGLHEFNYSVLVDQDIVDFFLQLPPFLRLKRKYFLEFLKDKTPHLYKIRRERYLPETKYPWLKKIYKLILKFDYSFKTYFFFKKTHKQVRNWLKNYKKFLEFLTQKFQAENSYFKKIVDFNKILKLISKKQWTSSEFCLIFRFLTIKMFLDKLLELESEI